MTEQTSTGDLQVPRLPEPAQASGRRAGPPAPVLHRPRTQRGVRVARAQAAGRRRARRDH